MSFVPVSPRYLKKFTVSLGGLSDLRTHGATDDGLIVLTQRISSWQAILMWEPFTGTIASTGNHDIVVIDTLAHLPAHAVSTPVCMKVRGMAVVGKVVLTPKVGSGGLKFEMPGETHISDAVEIDGGSISWIMDP